MEGKGGQWTKHCGINLPNISRLMSLFISYFPQICIVFKITNFKAFIEVAFHNRELSRVDEKIVNVNVPDTKLQQLLSFRQFSTWLGSNCIQFKIVKLTRN